MDTNLADPSLLPRQKGRPSIYSRACEPNIPRIGTRRLAVTRIPDIRPIGELETQNNIIFNGLKAMRVVFTPER